MVLWGSPWVLPLFWLKGYDSTHTYLLQSLSPADRGAAWARAELKGARPSEAGGMLREFGLLDSAYEAESARISGESHIWIGIGLLFAGTMASMATGGLDPKGSAAMASGAAGMVFGFGGTFEVVYGILRNRAANRDYLERKKAKIPSLPLPFGFRSLEPVPCPEERQHAEKAGGAAEDHP